VLPEVFNPVVFRTGRFFAEFLCSEFLDHAGAERLSVLDLGTGSGVLAVMCAAHDNDVVATDLNPEAVKCAKLNASRNNYDDRIQVRLGDLFEPVVDECFDLILWNPPFFDGEPNDRFDMSWRSADAIERFAAAVSSRLNSGGRIVLLWSSQRPENIVVNCLSSHGLDIKVLREAHFGVEVLTIFEAQLNRSRASASRQAEAPGA
jgi:HemK-related putative methylase